MSAEPAVEWARLDPQVIELDRIAGWIVTGVLTLGLMTALLLVWLVPVVPAVLRLALVPLTLAAVAAIGWLAYRWPVVEYRHAAYRVLPDRLEIRRGVVWRTVIAVPRSRVQHIDVSQGPIERRFGLGSLSVYTAGTDYSRVNLRGLAHGTALGIRDALLPADTPDGI